jgi:hypothetical protein
MSPAGLFEYEILFIVHFIFIIPGIIWFWILRNNFPIQQRKPYYVIFAAICFFMAQQFSNIKLGFEGALHYRGVYRLLTNLCFFMTLHIVALRFFLLFFWDLTTRLSIQFYNSEQIFAKGSDEKKIKVRIGKWILRNRALLSDKFWLLWSIFFGSLAFLICCIFVFQHPQVLTTSASNELLDRFDSYSRVLVSIYSIFCVIIPLILMLYTMRGFEDNFFIKREFKWSIVAAVVNAICSFLGSWSVTSSELNRLNISSIIGGMIPLFFYIFISIYLVIFWSHSSKSRLNKSLLNTSYDMSVNSVSPSIESPRSTRTVKDDLKIMLRNQDAREKFFEFLKKEFAVENLNQRESWEYAHEIYEKFIDPKGQLAVNICDSIRKPLARIFASQAQTIPDSLQMQRIDSSKKKEIDLEINLGLRSPSKENSKKSLNDTTIPDNFSADIFECAQLEILTLLALDSFLRFKQTPEFSPHWISFASDKQSSEDNNEN